ncbi:MAG: penicillin acylase family protein, partial [Candidatus Hydrogenedentes bacterium]|nr:penicillin acylase family protein [Candidatus Hydrogenedentota bacterium]
MRRLLTVVAVLVVALAGFVVFSRAGGPSRAEYIAAAQHYDVRILRDSWGVPHIFGKTDADTAFGLAYAQAVGAETYYNATT